MRTALSPITQRIVAVGLLVLLVAILTLGVIKPVLDAFDEQGERIAEKRDMLAAYERIAARRPALERRLAKLERDLGTNDIYLAPGPESVVAAHLQNRVKATLEKSGAVMLSAQVLPMEEEQGFQQITLRVRMNTDVNALNRTLYSLESGEPYLFLDNVDISARRTQRDADGEGGSDADATFSVLFDIFGYVRPT